MSFVRRADGLGEAVLTVLRRPIVAMAFFSAYAAAGLIEIALISLTRHSGAGVALTALLGGFVHHFARKYGNPTVMFISVGTLAGVAVMLLEILSSFNG